MRRAVTKPMKTWSAGEVISVSQVEEWADVLAESIGLVHL